MRIEKCGGHEEHFWGHVHKRLLHVYGRPEKRMTASRQEKWQIPRPRDIPLFFLSASSTVGKDGELIPDRPDESGSSGFVLARKRGRKGRPKGSESHAIPLPAWCNCWGCGYLGWVKPGDEAQSQTP